uniref:Uncharacterized protein n=1 Tax=Proboscia inermis TaxID=420281 RepID=A0A7S0C791_9STRA|mmetsp:Transcript_3062/g.3091  ORF Transcript_3062/g.3091 Transcript_3062/m.3091 type:complete len:130 (+) Transcript_3062:68-457(+)
MKEFYDIETKNNKQNPPTSFIKRRRLFYIAVDSLATQDSKDFILKPLLGRSDQRKRVTRQGRQVFFRDPFIPRQSKRMKHSRRQEILKGDDDIWIEIIGNSQRTGNKRSYFKSKRTGQLVWDEPPSGAG